MVFEVGAVALFAAGGAYAYALVQRVRTHARFQSALDTLAQNLGGRASPGTLFAPPELRVTISGTTAVMRLKSIEHPDRSVAVVEVMLPQIQMPHADPLRLYVGWGVASVPNGLEDLHEIPQPTLLDGHLIVRTSDPVLTTRFMPQACEILVDIKQQTQASALEILCRSGLMQFAVHGIADSARRLEQILLSTLRLKQQLCSSPASDPPISQPSVTIPATCSLCHAGYVAQQEWVVCKYCRAPYHQRCWIQATGCILPGCSETSCDSMELK